jgi:transposase
MERQSRRHYTDEYKAQAVSLTQSLGLAGAARKLGISPKSIANWVRSGGPGAAVNGGTRRSVSELEAEVSRLRAENSTLRQERDFLKKTTAFFAKESR